MRQTLQTLLVFLLSLAAPLSLHAEEPPLLGSLFTQVALDPTTYVPAPIAYSASRRDWDTSQVFFQHGYLEANPYYTISDRPNSYPVSYQEGNRRVRNAALWILGFSALNNLTEEVVEHQFLNHQLEHRTLVRTLGWIERIGFAAGLTYVQSHRHFQQATTNEQLARQYGWIR